MEYKYICDQDPFSNNNDYRPSTLALHSEEYLTSSTVIHIPIIYTTPVIAILAPPMTIYPL